MDKKKKKKPEEKYVFDLKATFLERLKFASGSSLFSICFCRDSSGVIVDVCKSGEFSCAVFVSNFLKMHNLIKIPTANVDTLEKELISCNWLPCRDANNPSPGAVLFWEPRKCHDGEMHRHAGFYYGKGLAISNDPRSGKEGSRLCPVFHDMYCKEVLEYSREIEKAYFHPLLRPIG